MRYICANERLPEHGKLCVVKVEVSGDMRFAIAYIDTDDKWICMLTGAEVSYKFRKVTEWKYFYE